MSIKTTNTDHAKHSESEGIPAPEGALREAAQKALDALLDTDATGVPPLFIQAAIDALRSALAAQSPAEGDCPNWNGSFCGKDGPCYRPHCQPQPKAAEVDELPDPKTDQAHAWFAVTNALNEVSPGWHKSGKTGVESAVATIRRLAQPQPKHTAETMTLQEVWDAMGGNPGIAPSRADVLLQLKLLDQICDEADAKTQAPAPAHDDKVLTQVLEERDAASDYIDALLDEVLGTDRHEWTSSYGHADAMAEVRERMASLQAPAVVDGPPALPNSFPSIWVPEANQCIDFTLFIREHLENRDDEWRTAIASARATVKDSLPVAPLADIERINSRRWRFAFIESDNWAYAVCKWDGDDWIPINTAADVQELDDAMAASKPPVQGSQS